MHANDGSVAENWIIKRGGWQLDRVNKSFGYMLGTTQADQKVSRLLSGWNPKEGARLPSLHALEQPLLDRARKLEALLFVNTVAFSESSLNLDEAVAECLAATLIMHYPDVLLLALDSALVIKMREAMSVCAVGEAEVLAWSATIRLDFHPIPAKTDLGEESSVSTEVLDLVKRQSSQIEVLILQNKRLEDRLLAVEAHLYKPSNEQPPGTDTAAATTTSQQDKRTVRPKRKGSQSLSATWYQWFTAEPRVYSSRSVKKQRYTSLGTL